MRETVIRESEWRDDGLIKHNLPAPAGLIEVETVIDVGAGIRPMQWYQPRRHICLEPHDRYCDKLRNAGYAYVQATASVLKDMTAEGVYLLDVIEHMEKHEGLEIIELAKKAATKQVIIYTPKGFLEQEGDAWGFGGDYWQKHRSGWLPGEFPGWLIEIYARSFFAIWNV